MLVLCLSLVNHDGHKMSGCQHALEEVVKSMARQVPGADRDKLGKGTHQRPPYLWSSRYLTRSENTAMPLSAGSEALMAAAEPK